MPTIAELAAEMLAGGPIADLPAALQPSTRAEAYAIQDASLGSPDLIGGWKVTIPKPGEVPACAPVVTSRIFETGCRYSPPRSGALQLEGEIALEIGRDLPPGDAPYDQAVVAAAVRATLPAFEVLGSRYIDRKAVAPLAVLADFQSNAAIIKAPGRPGWSGIDFSRAHLTASINGRQVASVDQGSSREEVLDALTWLANHSATRCGGLRAGQVIITGARIRPFAAGADDHVTLVIDGLGDVSMQVGS
jgi:2-keto-4-pentenoate hydratase